MHHTADKELIPKGKNSLAIRLTEAAVFLRSDGSIHTDVHNEDRSSVLRGLLILNLAKPTKISGIEIELVGKSDTTLPEGVGPRRIDVTEQHRFFRASTTYFEAGKAHSRRTASIGPGVAYNPNNDSHHDDSWEELNTSLRRRRLDGGQNGERDRTSYEDLPLYHRRQVRNASVDTSHYQPQHVSYHEERLPHAPPYSPYALSPAYSSSSHAPSPISSPYSLTRNPSPEQSLEDFRATLNRDFDTMHERNSSNLSTAITSSQTTSTQSYRSVRPGFPISRQASTDGVAEAIRQYAESSQNIHRGSQTPPKAFAHPDDHDRDRGRRKHHGRFSLANVSHALMDVMRSGTPMVARSRESSRDGRGNIARGRTTEKRPLENVASPSTDLPEAERSRTRTRHQKEHLLDKVGEMLKLDVAEHKDPGRDWKEFKKGVYTYPISFQIPADSPPTMSCDYGAVTWHLRAHVHRPGAFRAKYTAERDVIVISCPTEDDTEENENIIVERHWDQQLQYLIVISGRSFYIGGTLPVTFTMLPLAKAKVYRVAIYLEERVDYHTNMRKVARSDPVKRFELLCIRDPAKNASPILPLQSDDPEAFRKSPLYPYLSSQIENEGDISQVASNFMGPGPWAFHLDAKLPKSCTLLKPTNKNKRANMTVTHSLKVVMRMERGDDTLLDRNGKRKLFDVVIQTPVHIISCRCNPEWTSLPRYSESLNPVEHVVHDCPCRHGHAEHLSMHRPHLERASSHESTDSNVSAADDQPVNPVAMASLRRPQHDLMVANTLFERLVSGQETEMGETPPAYEDASPRPVLPLGVDVADMR